MPTSWTAAAKWASSSAITIGRAARWGRPTAWSQALRTALRILLTTHHPSCIFWGPQLICFYNDAYRRSLGPERHPGMLGARLRELWSETWSIMGPQIERVMSGGIPTWQEDHLVRRAAIWQARRNLLDLQLQPHR